MPTVLKGKLEYNKVRYPWGEYLDGKARIFKAGKDFKDKNSFVSTVHQAASRHGIRAMTVASGNDVKVQALTPAKAKARAVRKPKAAAKQPKAKTPRKAAKRARKAKETNSVATDTAVN